MKNKRLNLPIWIVSLDLSNLIGYIGQPYGEHFADKESQIIWFGFWKRFMQINGAKWWDNWMMLAMTLKLVQVYVKDVFLVHAFSAQYSTKQCEVGAMQKKGTAWICRMVCNICWICGLQMTFSFLRKRRTDGYSCWTHWLNVWKVLAYPEMHQKQSFWRQKPSPQISWEQGELNKLQFGFYRFPQVVRMHVDQ